MKNARLILLLSLLSIALLFIFEQILVFDYVSKTITKIITFFIVIFIFHYITKTKPAYFGTQKMDFRRLKISAGLGVGLVPYSYGSVFCIKGLC